MVLLVLTTQSYENFCFGFKQIYTFRGLDGEPTRAIKL
jgi:hypothetical protein